jgi:succinyl-diaminopimelate desuccinylase
MTRSTDPVVLAQALLSCPSLTPDDAGTYALVESILQPLGFEFDVQTFAADGTIPVRNLFAKRGSGSPHFLFAGHVDVVPTGDATQWSAPPFAADIKDGVLYGRGAVDMKGAVACKLAAMARFLELNPDFRGALSLLLTADEEGPAVNGTAPMLAYLHGKGERFDACVLGEPTNPQAVGDAYKIGRRGSLSATLTVRGVQGHVAYPHLAHNPLKALRRLLDALDHSPLDGGSEHFQASNLEIVSIDTNNPSFNVIPLESKAKFNIRWNDRFTAQSLIEELEQRLQSVDLSGFSYTLDVVRPISDCFRTAPGRLVDGVMDGIRMVTGRDADGSTSGGTSDARFIKDYCPVVEFGLVGQTMHQIDERVPVSDLETLTQIYVELLKRFFAGGS